MEWKLFDGGTPYVSTFAFHRDRERAPHLEQEWHRPRLEEAARLVREAAYREFGAVGNETTHSDLGCGDGGLLQLLKDTLELRSWGYDFQPSNQAGWAERGVNATALDVFGADWDRVEVGTIVSMTEVLEHLADPHRIVRELPQRGARWLVCSSPANENNQIHDACHAWAWDMDGYAALLEQGGWTVRHHMPVGLFQVVLAEAVTW